MYFVYLLRCKANKSGKITIYCGQTNNLERRFKEHIEGKAKSTRGRQVELVYEEKHPTRSKAMKRELEIKSFKKKVKLELIRQYKAKGGDEVEHITIKLREREREKT